MKKVSYLCNVTDEVTIHRQLDAQTSRRMLAPYTEHLGNLLIPMEQEIWKPVLGYEGLYEVSNHEEVRRANTKSARKIKKRLNKKRLAYQFFQVDLCQNGVKKTHRLSHIVCEAFCGPRPDGYQCMHIDGNPQNDKPENLAWGTIYENSNEPIRRGKLKDVAKWNIPNLWRRGVYDFERKPVIQYSLNGEIIAEYPSTREAERQTGIDHITISRACRGKLKTSGGYIWKFKN